MGEVIEYVLFLLFYNICFWNLVITLEGSLDYLEMLSEVILV